MSFWQKLIGSKQAENVDVFRVGSDGMMKKTTAQRMAEREKARDEHERAVEIMDRGDYRGALKVFNAALKATTDDPDPMNYLNIAVCHAHLREFRQSLAVLEQAMRLWPDNDRLRRNYEAIKREAK